MPYTRNKGAGKGKDLVLNRAEHKNNGYGGFTGQRSDFQQMIREDVC